MASPSEIEKFLYKVNLKHLIKIFEDEQIDYEILGYMTKKDFDNKKAQLVYTSCAFRNNYSKLKLLVSSLLKSI